MGSSVLNIDLEDESHEDVSFSQALIGKTIGGVSDEKIQELKELAKNRQPKRVEVLLQKIARTRAFAIYIKERNGYICEICSREPFIQKNGKMYAEADHIIPLGKKANGLDHPDNMRCVCAQCHVVITHGADDEIAKLFAGNGYSVPT